MSNKDYYAGGGQAQYYPPQGALSSRTVVGRDRRANRWFLPGPPPGQGGYYPQQPQQSYQGQPGYGQQPGYHGGQPGYQPQPAPQTVYVQQPTNQRSDSGTGCLACLAGACLCCCAEEMLCDCLF
ncbi:hypothetical protein SCLCIDRAFT_1220302 [Scleroderma citrinum Foug A]|uniref:Cysteine-rich transmembrane CYSTM domain-containing protein n=1 Tax=Scleroderma citrinum Foug A TaxID=1036808 RepID=A0A0C3DKA2_9AGAM|nr:hypothetical protein SCLCIDRAFT_1220302 [Scleroderma citrinum Foug A]